MLNLFFSVDNQAVISSAGEWYQKLNANAKWCVLVRDVTKSHALGIVIFSIVTCLSRFPVKSVASLVAVEV